MARALATLAVTLLLTAAASFAARHPADQLPPIVRHYFEMQWPLARITSVDHTTEKGSEFYDIVARNHGHRLDVVFKEDGDVMLVRESVPTDELSSFVTDGVRQAYPHSRIRQATKLIYWSNITYDAVVRDRNHRDHSLAIAFDGRILATRD